MGDNVDRDTCLAQLLMTELLQRSGLLTRPLYLDVTGDPVTVHQQVRDAIAVRLDQLDHVPPAPLQLPYQGFL
jgi:hypothetical protein